MILSYLYITDGSTILYQADPPTPPPEEGKQDIITCLKCHLISEEPIMSNCKKNDEMSYYVSLF